MTISDCVIQGHNLEADPEKEVETIDGITHLYVRCKRCSHKMLLKINEKNSL